VRLLLIHAEYFQYEARIKASTKAEPLTEENRAAALNDVLIVFAGVEEQDRKHLAQVIEKACEEIVDRAKKLGVNCVLIYPFNYLAPSLAPPEVFITAMAELERKVSSNGLKVLRAPYGWYKRFHLRCKNHPLAEVSLRIAP